MSYGMSRKDIKKLLVALSASLVFANPSVTIGKPDGGGPTAVIGPVRTVVAKSSTGEKGATVEVWTNTYDSQGRLIASEDAYNFKTGDLKTVGGKTIFSYNSEGKRTEKISYGTDGSLMFKSIYTYDDKGNMTEEASYKADGSLRNKWVSIHDSKGNGIEVKFYVDNSIKSRLVNTYDKQGNIVESTFYRPADSVDYKSVNTYDGEGNITQGLIYNSDGSLDRKISYSYNASGKLTEMMIYNSNGLLREKETYAYEFDSAGNWIKKTTAKWVNKEGKLSPEPPILTKRTITYYSDQPAK